VSEYGPATLTLTDPTFPLLPYCPVCKAVLQGPDVCGSGHRACPEHGRNCVYHTHIGAVA